MIPTVLYKLATSFLKLESQALFPKIFYINVFLNRLCYLKVQGVVPVRCLDLSNVLYLTPSYPKKKKKKKETHIAF